MKIEYHTFPELADIWLSSMAHITESSRNRYAFAVQSLCEHFNSLNGGLVEAVEKWQIKRRSSAKPQTFNLELSTLRAILAYGLAHGRPKINPAAELRPQRVLRVEKFVPSREQYQAIVEFIAAEPFGKRASLYLRLLATSGMRQAEADALRWSDVNQSASITIGCDGNTKSGKARVLPMFAALERVLYELANEPDFNPQGLVIGHVDLRYWIAQARRELKLPFFRAHHTWRSYFVRESLKAGVHVAVVAKFVGHQDCGSLLLKTYNILADSQLAEGAAKINASHSASAIVEQREVVSQTDSDSATSDS